MSATRWGILGPGYIAGVFAEDLAKTSGAELVAVASRDAGRAQAFASRHKVPRSYGAYAELAADDDIDVVYIATPHSHHFEHAMLMLEGGKNILVEKPFAMTASQTDKIQTLARSKGLFAMDAMWTLCNPLYRQLQSRISEGEIGEVRAFMAQIGPMGIGDNSRVTDPDQGGSFALECLVYPLCILAGLAPGLLENASVMAQGITTSRRVDTAATITLASEKGYATMAGGFVPASQGNGGSGFQVIGDLGWLAVTDNLFNPGRAMVGSANGVEEILHPGADARYRWEIEEVHECLNKQLTQSERVPHSLTLTVMRILDAARDQIARRSAA